MSRLRRAALPGQLSLLELLDELTVLDRLEARPDAGAQLGEWERAVLAFAAEHHLSGRYAERVQQQLGCSATRYLQALSGMLDRPEVLAAEPALISQLRAIRDRRQRLRALSRGLQPGAGVPFSPRSPGRVTGQG